MKCLRMWGEISKGNWGGRVSKLGGERRYCDVLVVKWKKCSKKIKWFWEVN